MGFRSLTEAIDLTTSGNRLVFHLSGALGQFEHDLIEERTRSSLAAAAARGRIGGRRPVVTPRTNARIFAPICMRMTATKSIMAASASHSGISRLWGEGSREMPWDDNFVSSAVRLSRAGGEPWRVGQQFPCVIRLGFFENAGC